MVCDTPYLQNEFGDPDFFYVFNLILSFSTCSQSFKKMCTWELLGANVIKLFLDIVSSSSADITCVLRGSFLEGSVYMYVASFRLISKQRKTSNVAEMFSLIFWLQASEPRLSVCFNTFPNFNRNLNKRRVSPTQTITTEWRVEKCLGRLDKWQTTNALTQARQPNKQIFKSAGRLSLPKFQKQFKKQRQQRRLKDDFIFNLRNLREFRFIQFVYTVSDIPNRI